MIANAPRQAGHAPGRGLTPQTEVMSAAPASRSLDWAVTATSALVVGGFWLDAWAHVFLPQLETFFTPWHGVLYSGLLATVIVLAVAAARGFAAHRLPRLALPLGYGVSLIGALVFAAGGLSDLAWHTAFGIETGVDALLSPPHLVLALGGSLMITGPLRAAWHRPWPVEGEDWAARAPAILSLALLLSLWAGFTEYANPFASPWPGTAPIGDWAMASGVADLRAAVPSSVGQLLGMTGIVVQTTLLMGGVLFLLRRWTLPFGAVMLIFTIAIGLLSAAHEQVRFIPAALAGGLVADLLLVWLRSTTGRRGALRVFAFAAPVVLFTLYFATLAATERLSWPPSLWIGAILEAGVVGLVLSYLILPPAVAAGPPS